MRVECMWPLRNCRHPGTNVMATLVLCHERTVWPICSGGVLFQSIVIYWWLSQSMQEFNYEILTLHTWGLRLAWKSDYQPALRHLLLRYVTHDIMCSRRAWPMRRNFCFCYILPIHEALIFSAIIKRNNWEFPKEIDVRYFVHLCPLCLTNLLLHSTSAFNVAVTVISMLNPRYWRLNYRALAALSPADVAVTVISMRNPRYWRLNYRALGCFITRWCCSYCHVDA